jgi:hypothetical protein
VLAVAAATAIRSGLFSLRTPIDDEQVKALWAFIGAGIAAVATLLASLLTFSHNRKTLALQRESEARKQNLEQEAAIRATLETVISGLGLVTTGNTYAPKAAIAGGLACLVQLGHPTIAMRALAAALNEDAVDRDTTAWLLGQVLVTNITTGTQQDLIAARGEAAALLRSYAPRLTFPDDEGAFSWPDVLLARWPQGLEGKAQSNLVLALVRLLLSQDKTWWRDVTWVIYTLDEAVANSDVLQVKSEAAGYGLALLGVISDEWILGGNVRRQRGDVIKRMTSVSPIEIRPAIRADIRTWGTGP